MSQSLTDQFEAKKQSKERLLLAKRHKRCANPECGRSFIPNKSDVKLCEPCRLALQKQRHDAYNREHRERWKLPTLEEQRQLVPLSWWIPM